MDNLRLFNRGSTEKKPSEWQKNAKVRLKRRTHVIRIFPNEESCLRLVGASAVEIHEDWSEAHRYLNTETLREQRKQLQLLEAA